MPREVIAREGRSSRVPIHTDVDVPVSELAVGFRSRALYRERFVCLVCRGNPLVEVTHRPRHVDVDAPRLHRPARHARRVSSKRRWRSSEGAVAWRWRHRTFSSRPTWSPVRLDRRRRRIPTPVGL